MPYGVVAHDNPMVMMLEILECPNTDVQLNVFGKDVYSNDVSKNTELSKDSAFIGIELSGYVGFGGSIKIGINLGD